MLQTAMIVFGLGMVITSAIMTTCVVMTRPKGERGLALYGIAAAWLLLALAAWGVRIVMLAVR